MVNIKAFLKVFLLLFVILLFVWQGLAKAYEDSTTVTSSPYLYIPDGTGENECGDEVYDYIYTSLVPNEAIVLSIDIFFAVSHNWPKDLVVILQYDDTNYIEILWNYGSAQGLTFTKNGIWSFFGLKANANWKLKIKDCDQYITGTLDTWTLKVRYHVPPDPPAFVWASTGSGQREINVGWTPVLDTQCVSYRIEWNRNDYLLNNYNIIEGMASVLDCDYTSKTINWLKCVDYYYIQMRVVSMYGAFSRPSWPLAGALSSYCENVFVNGQLKYVGYDDQYADYSYYPDVEPLENVFVSIWDAVTGYLLSSQGIYTDDLGEFWTTLSRVENPIYVKFTLFNQDNSLIVHNYDNDSLITTSSDTLGPDSSFYIVRDEKSPEEHDIRFARACYSYEYLQNTKIKFQLYTSWDTPPVLVFYDYDNVYDVAFSHYDSLYHIYWIYLTSMGPPNFAYRLYAPIHEYAHLIQVKAWNLNSMHTRGCPLIHSFNTTSTPSCAFDEGWAEYLSCVITGDKARYLKDNGWDLENNDWWAGPDGVNVDGSIVEGAVASAWYDMEDENIDNPDEFNGTQYYDLYGEFAKIFDIFKSSKPQNMIEFMRYWQNYPGLEDWEKEHLIKIFAQHHIVLPVSGDVNCDGKVSIADIVYLINYLFKGGPAPNPYWEWKGDVNGDCKISVSDTVYLINYLFKGGPAPTCNTDCWSCS